MRITKPTLLVNEEIARANIKRMAEKAHRSGVVLRPHFKTHQSIAIGKLFQEAGIDKITVSSVSMAQYFADAGWKDITIAFPYNPLESSSVVSLAKKIKLQVTIVSKSALDHLNENVQAEVGYFIKVDVGTHRTGVDPNDTSEIRAMSNSQNSNHHLVGLMAHAGHAYTSMSQEKATDIYNQSITDFKKVSDCIDRNDLIYSYGDTPTCSMLDDFPGVHEIRPGNFVFYDLTQESYGTCGMHDIAVCMACPVVSIHPGRNEAVVYGGAVHFSKDAVLEGDQRHFGKVVALGKDGWRPEPIAEVDRLSQEHGILRGSSAFIQSLKVGQLVGILPVHSCLTADLQGHFLTLSGEKLDKMPK